MKPETNESPTPVAGAHDASSSTIGASDTRTTAEAQAPTGNPRQISIRLALASLVAACVLPVWIAAGFLVYHNYQSRRALTEQRMLETARALTMVVDRQLASMQAGLSVLATSPSLASGNMPALYSQARVVLEAYPGADIILADASGQQLFNTFLPFGSPLPKRNVPETVRQVYATARPVITSVFQGAVTGKKRISVDVPVFRNGRVVYELAMTVPADHFSSVLLQQHLPPEWVGRIYDGDQVLIARTRLAEEFVGRKAEPIMEQRIRNAAEGAVENINFEGVPMFNSFSRSATFGWTVVIGVPKVILIAEIWRWLWWTVVGTAFFSLTGILLALYMARRIAGSIQSLTVPALALGRGESVTIGHLGLSEADEVGSSLVKASRLIQQRAKERECAEAARRETEDLKLLNAELERSEAEARARATELAAIMDAVPAVTLIAHDRECRQITSNRTGYDLLRLPRGFNISTSSPESEHSLHHRLLRNGRELSPEEMPLQLAVAGLEIRDFGYTLAFDDGSSREMFGNAVPILDESARIRGAVGAFIDITERKGVDKQLRATVERLQAILENAPVGIVVNNREGGVLESNAAYQRMCGYSAEELKYMRFTDYTHPDDVTKNLQLYDQLQSKNLQNFEMEKRYIRKDATIIWVRLVASKINEDTNIGIIEDITARKQAEQELKATTERLQAILENVPVGIATGSHNHFEETNPAFQRMTGYSADELQQIGWDALTHPDDIARNTELVNGLLLGTLKNYDFEKRYVLKDGRIIWVRVIGSRLDGGHKVSIIEDITERKQTEQVLRESEERYRRVFNDSMIGIYRTTPGGDILLVNPALARMLGCDSPDEVLRWKLDAEHFAPEYSRGEFKRELEEKGTIQGLESAWKRSDGATLYVRESAQAIRDDTGEVAYYEGTVEDITERKRTEKALRESEERLRQAQKMEAVGRLAGGVAHDFNNLLMVIQSYTELLHENLSAHDTLRRNTQAIMKATERAAGLTRQLLAFSRKQILSPVVLNLDAVIHETAKMLKRLIGEDIEFRVGAAESLWTIEADPDQMVQVLMNLCVNARDAMPEGGTLTIATGNVTVAGRGIGGQEYVNPGDYVWLSVTDTGIGISKEMQGQIFEPFFTTKEVGKGTGLGLATVYGIVKQSNGYVWVESDRGRGACFTIYLPRVKRETSAKMAAEAETQTRGTETILVTEDEEAVREAVCDYLRSLEYTTLVASSGKEALALASQHEGYIDLLLTDLVMPGMSGKELSEILGSLLPGLKTIYMSGYAGDVLLRHGIHEVGTAFLQKPFSLSTLACKVRDTLDQGKTVH
jgi:PAS domain S-box-containing protein